MKPGVYWYRGPMQTSWNSDDPWKMLKDWMIVAVCDQGYGAMVGNESSIWPEDLERMQREGKFIAVARPAPQESDE